MGQSLVAVGKDEDEDEEPQVGANFYKLKKCVLVVHLKQPLTLAGKWRLNLFWELNPRTSIRPVCTQVWILNFS